MIFAVVGILALLIYIIMYQQEKYEEGVELEARIKCIGGHQYYYIWGGGHRGGPSIAPIMTFEGKPKECKGGIKIVNGRE